MTAIALLDPLVRLDYLESVLSEHNDCDRYGWCTACRRAGQWAPYPCDLRVGAERAADETREVIARGGLTPA